VSTAAPRPRRPTLAEFRDVAQPPEIRERATSEHWIGHLYQRDLSPYLSRPLALAGFSPNAVTAMMICCGIGGGLALLLPGLMGAVLAALLVQLQMLLDCADGEVARWTGRFSPAGIFLDKVGHYSAESMIPLCLGVRAAGGLFGMDEHYGYVALGAVLALVIVLNKALNEMVHVARAFTGLGRLPEQGSTSAPRRGLLARLRSMARFVPFHRLYHSVEMTLIILLVTVVFSLAGADAASVVAARWLVIVLTPLAVLSLIGHLVAILTSSRLRAES
jgi:phosphatidylglycerophosphate synthase